MIFKYKVPRHYQKNFENKKTIYCKVVQETEAINHKVYLVKMINYYNISNILADYELNNLNLWDKIKILFMEKGEYKCIK